MPPSLTKLSRQTLQLRPEKEPDLTRFQLRTESPLARRERMRASGYRIRGTMGQLPTFPPHPMQPIIEGNERALRTLLERFDRIGITGTPKAGKTTLTERIRDRAVLHTDDWIDAGWDQAPLEVIKAAGSAGLLVVEGVIVPRALRKGLQLDALLWLPTPLQTLNTRQVAMAQAQLTVLEGLSPRLPVFTPIKSNDLPRWMQVLPRP